MKCRVLYGCLDSSPRTMRSRVQALCAGRGIDPPENLFFDFSPLNLAQPAGQERLRGMVSAQKASFVVLDVLARYLPGVDENAVASIGPVFTLLRGIAAESGASFLVVHHFNKSGVALAPTARMQRVRGSSDIAAAVDAALSVTLSGSRLQPRRTITPEKNRDLPEEPPFDFSLEAADTPPGAPGAGALKLVFSEPAVAETAGEAFERAFDLVLEILRSQGQALTRVEIEERLRGAFPGGQRLSGFALNRLFAGLAESGDVAIGRAGRLKRYRWAPPSPRQPA